MAPMVPRLCHLVRKLQTGTTRCLSNLNVELLVAISSFCSAVYPSCDSIIYSHPRITRAYSRPTRAFVQHSSTHRSPWTRRRHNLTNASPSRDHLRRLHDGPELRDVDHAVVLYNHLDHLPLVMASRCFTTTGPSFCLSGAHAGPSARQPRQRLAESWGMHREGEDMAGPMLAAHASRHRGGRAWFCASASGRTLRHRMVGTPGAPVSAHSLTVLL